MKKEKKNLINFDIYRYKLQLFKILKAWMLTNACKGDNY